MNKQNNRTQLIKTASEKIAKLTIDSLEDRLGLYLNDDQEAVARPLIEKQIQDSFALRHPVLTGLPTLGIWPAIAESNATSHVVRQLLKKDPLLREEHQKGLDKAFQQRVEWAKANALQDAAATAADAYITGKTIEFSNSKNK